MVRFTSKKSGEVWFEGVRVSSRMPCPICEGIHKDQGWCLLDPYRGLAICPRVESKQRIGDAGWLHNTANNGSCRSIACFINTDTPDPVTPPSIREAWERAVEEARVSYPPPSTSLSAKWGIHWEFIHNMDVGILGDAWAFAMRDKNGDVCGVKLRTFRGKKLCIKGSRLGYIAAIDGSWKRGNEVYVTEGESDLAAALAMGLPAIARPGCSTLVRFLPKLLVGRNVVIIRDNDEAGISGAALLRNALAEKANSVVIVSPRAGAKDLRDWFHKGGTADDVRCIAKALRGW